jgi:hypothetical protein
MLPANVGERWQRDSREVARGATPGKVACVEAVEAPSLVLAVNNLMVGVKAPIAAAAKVLFKGLGSHGAKRRWLACKHAAGQRWHSGGAPSAPAHHLHPFL